MRIILLGTILAASVLNTGVVNAQKSKKSATPVTAVEKVDINKAFKTGSQEILALLL